ncbi:MAG: hypothetical protein J0H02_02930, partial [Armatimonadetes bacterium]|nr:hypothetical protein [Armatimonadota bacterium]
MSNPALIISWAALFGQKAPFADIVSVLSKLKATNAIRVLTRMAFSMQRLGAGDEYQLRFAGDLLNQEVRIQIDQFVKERRSGDPKFREIIFTRTQLLAAIKLIMLVCPRDRGVTLEEANVRLEFGEALLKLNDYLLDPSGDRWSEPVNLLTSESRVLRALINSFA